MAAVDYPAHRPVVVIERGTTYTEWRALAGEKMKIFIATFPPGQDLAVDQTVHLVDLETGLPMPYTSPTGFYIDFREWYSSFDGRVRLMFVMDELPPLVMHPRPHVVTHDYEMVVFGDSVYFDPDAELEHTLDFTVSNLDTVPLTGSAQICCIVRMK